MRLKNLHSSLFIVLTLFGLSFSAQRVVVCEELYQED